jgi:hypothetical protein
MSSAKAPASGQLPVSNASSSAKKESSSPVETVKIQVPAPPPPPAKSSSSAPAPVTTTAAYAQPVPLPAPEAIVSPVKHPLPGTPLLDKSMPALPKAAIFGIVAGAVLLFVLLIVSLWKVFEKAGQAGWKSLIPIYNYVVFLNIIVRPVWWVILLFVPIVSFIVIIVMHVDLAKRFGKGALFGLGLCLLPFIFFPLLAFGDATYA